MLFSEVIHGKSTNIPDHAHHPGQSPELGHGLDLGRDPDETSEPSLLMRKGEYGGQGRGQSPEVTGEVGHQSITAGAPERAIIGMCMLAVLRYNTGLLFTELTLH